MGDLREHLINRKFTPRQIEIAILAGSSSDTAKELAVKLFIDPKTIRFHLSNIYSKLGFKRRGELIHFIGTWGRELQ